MKNIKYIVLVLILSISGTSCTDFLDVRPENEMLLDDFWQKESDVEAVVMTCYRAMQEDDFMWRTVLWGELRSDNMVPASGADNREKQVHNVNILATNDLCKWGSFYQVINYCNTVLQYAPDVVDRDANFTEADLRVKEAEVRAIRALCYFYLVRTFRDIPWSETATVDDEQNLLLPQLKPEETLEKITADLLWAEEWAMEEYLSTTQTKGRMTKDAIRALLADVYLWRRDYTKCIEYCDKLINATTIDKTSLVSNKEVIKYEFIDETNYFNHASYYLFYQGNASESIFELQFTSEKDNDALKDLYGTGQTNRGGVIRATQKYAESQEEATIFSKTDIRRAESIFISGSASSEYRIFKYMGYAQSFLTGNSYSYSSSPPNWIFYRIADIMLMRAEALVQLNRSESDLRDALATVNKTYMRSNPTLLETDTLNFANYSDPNTLDKLILRERQRELMFEGKRWFDLVRRAERSNSTEELVSFILNKYDADISTITNKMSVMNAIYLPIHQDELSLNPLLEQNPYYESSSTIKK